MAKGQSSSGVSLLNSIELSLSGRKRSFPFKTYPFPHILVKNSQKKLHGWYPGKRECTGERFLINPYAGCFHDCIYCYAKAFPGYFELFRERKIAAVFEGFPEEVARQLDSLRVAACGYLSPVTDPFNPLNDIYKLSEKIIRIFVERNLPIEFITKGVVTEEALNWMCQQEHSFGQVSIVTTDSAFHRKLSPGTPSLDKLWENFSIMKEAGVPAVLRIDPIIPLFTDSEEDLRFIMERARNYGVKHVVVSCLDIPVRIASSIFEFFKRLSLTKGKKMKRIYRERIGPYLHADFGYRRELFDKARRIAEKVGLTFALCMEFRLVNGRPEGLNRSYMTSVNCEGIDVPIYIKEAELFEPACDCSGNCLNCNTPLCGIPELALKVSGKTSLTLSDYRRFGERLFNPQFF